MVSETKFRVLTLDDAAQWDQYVMESDNPDIYFLSSYSKVFTFPYPKEVADTFSGTPLVFVAEKGNSRIIEIFFKRRINDLEFAKDLHTEFFDMISPYGYSGPLVKNINKEPDLVHFFLDNIKNYCEKNNIVTSFRRFHPMLSNHEIYDGNIDLQKRNRTVFIDLTKDVDSLLKEMDKKTRNLISKGTRAGLRIRHTDEPDDYHKFYELYSSTMNRNNAKNEYFLADSFFQNSLREMKGNITLFVVEYESKVISASVFLFCGKNIHYHFSGSDSATLNLAPNNFLLFEVVKWAKEKGFERFHLGGGRTSSESDKLFHFKSGFSSTYLQFYTSSNIYKQSAYDELLRAKFGHSGKPKDEHYFPGYRGI